jgi:immunity protein, SdpI family
MSKRTYFLLAGGILLATLALTAIIFPQLPAQVPLHWNIHNQVDRYGSKWTLVALLPGIMAGTMLLMAALPWLSPRRFEVDEPRHFYLALMDILLVFLAYIQVLLILAATGRPMIMGRAVIGGICLLIAALGMVLPRVPRNFYVGIRTPWTIADERVWKATHRFAGIAMVAGGALAFALAMVQASVWPPMVLVMAAAFAPVIHSLVFYKQLARHGRV